MLLSRNIVIYIALTEEDIALAILKVRKGDVIITDLSCPTHKGRTILPYISTDEEEVLTKTVKHWLYELIGTHNYPKDLQGYVNNFYECTVRPLITYFRAIDSVIMNLDKKIVIFNLPRHIIWPHKTSTYYLAEHESSGVHLYDRHSVLLPYIEEYFKLLNLSVHQGAPKFPLKQILMNVARVWGVFAARFIKDIKNNIVRPHKNMPIFSKLDFIFLVRTNGQCSTILPFLKNTLLDVGVLIVDSNTSSQAVKFFKTNLPERHNVHIIFRKNVGLWFLLKSYMITYGHILKCKNINFKYSGINFNFKQAITELIVMSANLGVYKKQVERSLKDVSNNKLKMLLSMEQKSPHAYIDAAIAKNLSISSVQIKQCNQAYSPLPEPIFSQNFLCDTPEVLEKFQEAWPEYLRKLNYIGTFQGVRDTIVPAKNTERLAAETKKICFFAGVHQNININTIDLIQKINDQKVQIELTVKLHPRDNNIYTSLFPNIKIIETQDRSFSDFCTHYDAAVTYPSGVVSELIFNNLPFIIYKPNHKDYRDIANTLTPLGAKSASTDDELLSALSNIKELTEEFSIFQQNFLLASGVVIDITTIDENIRTLEKTMRETSY